MDEMILQFSSALSSENFEKYPHRDLYKIRSSHKSAQENRRMMMLNAQKEKRNALIDSARGLLELIKDTETSKSKSEKIYKPKVHVPGFTTKKQYYTDKLMLSEWMTECPKDLPNNWFALACPKGSRVLIVAAKGCTRAYTKQGYIIKSWQSLLPGGNSCEENYNKYCVLDGVWNPQTTSLYILDMLVWGTQTMTECELEFRNYWLHTKFAEIPGLDVVSSNNKYPIHIIQKHHCTIEHLNKFLLTWPAYPDNVPQVDGILFYHKNAFYVSGTTPLVVWLYPYMINEILGNDITVHLNYQAEKPSDYVNQKEFIEEFEKKQGLKQTKTKKDTYERRRVRSFSSISMNSSFGSSDSSEQSFYNGKVQMIFGDSKPKSKESEDVLIKSNKNKKDKKIKSKMDIEQNDAVEVDSAVSSMDESTGIANDSLHDTSSFSVTDDLDCD